MPSPGEPAKLYFKHEITINLQGTPLGPVEAIVSPACNKTGL